MRFYKEIYLRNMVVEWSDKYVDYKQLKKKVIEIKEKALELAQAYATIRELADIEVDATIELKKIKERAVFWKLLEEQIETVNKFYQEQVSIMLKHFHDLTKLCIALGLMSEFIPREKKFSSRLERELGRLKAAEVVKFITASNELSPVPEEPVPLEGKAFPIRHLRTKSQRENKIDNYGLDNAEVSSHEEHKMLSEISVPIETEEVPAIPSNPVKVKQAKDNLRDSFCELYRGLVLLQSYCELNYDAVRKILKKYDKNFGTTMQAHYLTANVQKLEFFKHAYLKLLTSETEHVFSISFTEGHRTQAMEKLRVPLNRGTAEMSFLSLGWNLGLSFPTLFVIAYLLSVYDHSIFPRFESVIICYRMLAMLILMVWCWGLDMWVWTKFRVNYVFIFEFDPRQHVRYSNMLEAASIFTVIWLFSLALYVFSATRPQGFSWLADIPFELHPLILIAITTAIFIRVQIKSNWWLTKTIYNIVTAPFHEVKFRDFFVGDQLISIAIVLYDFEYTLCFFLIDVWTGDDMCMRANSWTRPLIVMLPSLWRLLQSFRRYRDNHEKRHLWNAGKYATALSVAFFSALRANVSDSFLIFWLVAVICSTVYSNYWDIYEDWGLGHPENSYLRSKLLYNDSRIYYLVVITNFGMRLMWTLTISPESIRLIADPFILSVILACVEIIRRAQWNIFRLENEQLNNVGKFRAVNVIVPPIDQVSISGNLGAAKPIIVEKTPQKERSEEGTELQDVGIHYRDQPPTPNFASHNEERKRNYSFKIPKIFQQKGPEYSDTAPQEPKKKTLDFSKLSSFRYNNNNNTSKTENKSAPTSLQNSPVNNRLRSSSDASSSPPEQPLLSPDHTEHHE